MAKDKNKVFAILHENFSTEHTIKLGLASSKTCENQQVR